jgi:hypothetical protein
MTKKWIAVNLGLLAIAGLISWRLYVLVAGFRAGNDPAKIQPVRDLKPQAKLPAGLPPPKQLRRYNPAEFQNIPNQNLFAESRSNQPPEEPAPAVVQVVPELRAKPILVGITVAGDLRLASIIEPAVPGLPQNESRRSQTKRVGDVYQGYTIVDITEDQMILENGPRREVIPLFDSSKARPQGGKTPIVATRVVNFGGGGGTAAAGQRGPGVVAMGGSAQPQGAQASGQAPTVNQIFGAPQTAPPGAQPGAGRTAGQAQQGRQTPGNAPQATAPAQPPPAWNERIDEQGRRVIRTPFGDIIRDKPAEKPPNQ